MPKLMKKQLQYPLEKHLAVQYDIEIESHGKNPPGQNTPVNLQTPSFSFCVSFALESAENCDRGEEGGRSQGQSMREANKINRNKMFWG